ncbi:hypothetical protein TNCV_1417861 [Trichonephila clavipes]|nr:hypothetical protein TNCV_1417861 [Trichonephila clavipes]
MEVRLYLVGYFFLTEPTDNCTPKPWPVTYIGIFQGGGDILKTRRRGREGLIFMAKIKDQLNIGGEPSNPTLVYDTSHGHD